MIDFIKWLFAYLIRFDVIDQFGAIMPPKKASADWLRKIAWVDLDIVVPGRLVLRHNERLQYGYTPEPCETLRFALKKMQEYCKSHRDGNPKITGLVKVVENTKINNVPLYVKLAPIFRDKK